MSDSETEQTEDDLKILLLGDTAVGKSSLVKRFCRNEFTRQYFPTVGVDFFLKRLILQKYRNVTLKIWDVGGTAQNGNMLDKYVFGSDIIILIYDITNNSSFCSIELWLELAKNINKKQDRKPLLAIFGNKCDLEHQRMVRLEKHQRFASENHLFSQILSARTGECVNLAFQKLIAEYLGVKLSKAEIEEHQSVVKAEISTYSDLPVQPVRPMSTSRSSICLLQ
ncbi:hypothetical protein RUM44_012185 [Polyplax serrata]|uniref:Ras-related protein Rab-28 n=1 Tax=Polyplax serrata TaxID=468196 RepID=A0ABR1BF04_POLSC